LSISERSNYQEGQGHALNASLGAHAAGCGRPHARRLEHQEGVSWTYRKFNGFDPIADWLGLEGRCLEIEQRPGSQHSQEGFIPFLLRAIHKSRHLTKAPLLVRLDSAHDAIATLFP
jgi:hypothetical protein